MKTIYRSKKTMDLIVHDALLHIDAYYNVGRLDRGIRLLLGLAMIGVVYFVKIDSATALGGALQWWTLMPLFAVYPMITGFLGWDPIYAFFGASTDGDTPDQLQQLHEAVRIEEARMLEHSQSTPS